MRVLDAMRHVPALRNEVFSTFGGMFRGSTHTSAEVLQLAQEEGKTAGGETTAEVEEEEAEAIAEDGK